MTNVFVEYAKQCEGQTVNVNGSRHLPLLSFAFGLRACLGLMGEPSGQGHTEPSYSIEVGVGVRVPTLKTAAVLGSVDEGDLSCGFSPGVEFHRSWVPP